MLPQPEAIVVKNAKKRFGNGPMILNNLNMNITRGTM